MSKREKKQVSGLNILFKEVLQQIPEKEAAMLMDGYLRGENIVLILGQSSYGEDKKTAFGWTLTKSQDWRHLPEAVPGIN